MVCVFVNIFWRDCSTGRMRPLFAKGAANPRVTVLCFTMTGQI